jgi:hypothetical protein
MDLRALLPHTYKNVSRQYFVREIGNYLWHQCWTYDVITFGYTTTRTHQQLISLIMGICIPVGRVINRSLCTYEKPWESLKRISFWYWGVLSTNYRLITGRQILHTFYIKFSFSKSCGFIDNKAEVNERYRLHICPNLLIFYLHELNPTSVFLHLNAFCVSINYIGPMTLGCYTTVAVNQWCWFWQM